MTYPLGRDPLEGKPCLTCPDYGTNCAVGCDREGDGFGGWRRQMNKTELRKHAEDLAEKTTECIRAVLVKHNMGVIEGAEAKLDYGQHLEYSVDYAYQIYVDREETDLEYQARMDKQKQREAYEYDQYLKLKKKYEPT